MPSARRAMEPSGSGGGCGAIIGSNGPAGFPGAAETGGVRGSGLEHSQVGALALAYKSQPGAEGS